MDWIGPITAAKTAINPTGFMDSSVQRDVSMAQEIWPYRVGF
jgi:hypothetical protein